MTKHITGNIILKKIAKRATKLLWMLEERSKSKVRFRKKQEKDD